MKFKRYAFQNRRREKNDFEIDMQQVYGTEKVRHGARHRFLPVPMRKTTLQYAYEHHEYIFVHLSFS